MNELTAPETIGFLERVVRDPSIDVAKLEHIIALQERLLAAQAKREYADAMNRLQAEMPQVTRDQVNKFIGNRYATYEVVDRVIRPHYTKYGFSTGFRTSSANGRIRVVCVVRHTGGHEEADHELESGADIAGSRGERNKPEVQGVGSVVTYLKRYTLCAAFGIALQNDETDDDGEASRRQPYGRPPPPPRPQPQGNGEGWMTKTKRLIDEAEHTNNKIAVLRDRIDGIWDDAGKLEMFAGDAAWLAYTEGLFPPDARALHDLLEERIAELANEG